MSTGIERPVTIAVTGTHSTGKSTWLARLAAELRCPDVEVATVADLAEQALRIGFPILHNHTFASTLWIITKGMSLELEAWPHADVLLVDRPVSDALAYYRAALAYRREQPDPAAMRYLESLVTEHSGHYDLVFRTTLDPYLPLGDNKPRNHHAGFRGLADHHINQLLHEMRLPHELLPAGGHDQALARAQAFTTARLAGQPTD